MYQKVIIAGNLGRDPEMRYTPDGTPVTNFSVATNRRWTGSDGQQRDETAWFRVTVWRRMAEVCNQYLQKGRAVLIEGRLTPDAATGGPRVYQRNDGSYGAQYEITAETVKFLGGRGEAPVEEGPGAPEELPAEPEEEIPF
jgi:single-strand DNA-binding protein